MLSKFFNKLIPVLFLALFSAFVIIPFMWMFSTSLRLPINSFRLPPAIFPTEFILDNYYLVFERVPFVKFFTNTLRIAVTVTASQLFICSLSAYAFARLRFKGSLFLFILFLSAMMIPAQVTTIPQFIIMSKLRLVDSHASLILPALFNPLGIFLMRTYMMTIPRSFDEAAHIDGASKFYCFTRIIVPLSKPAFVVVGILSFIAVWNDFYRPLIYINTQSKMTLTLGLTALRGVLGAGNQSGVIAGVILSLIAPLIFYIVGQRYLIEGATIGGLKG